MPLTIACHSCCERGRRSANEDRILVDRQRGLFVVCDGAGGKIGGARAAEIVCATVEQRLDRIEDALRRSIVPEAQHALATTLLSAHDAIIDEQARFADRSSMTTTAALVALYQGGQLLVSHIGDSRVYLRRGPDLTPLTRDHSLENFLKDNPQFRPKSRQPGKTLVRALGLKSKQLRIEQRELLLERGDVILICSDGLTDSVPEWILREILGAADQGEAASVPDRLARAAINHGSMDNVSAVLLQVIDRTDQPHTSMVELDDSLRGWVAFVDGALRGRVCDLHTTSVIGADPSCTIVLDDGYTSSRHSEILRTERGFVLRDLESTNGTFINNVQVKGNNAPLLDGDLIRAGKTEMVFKSARCD